MITADHWRAVRARIHDDICGNAFDEKRNTFVQYYGGEALDASLLLIPQVGFLPADDPRIAGTVAAIERELMHHGLVLRYATAQVDDGIGGAEGAFRARRPGRWRDGGARPGRRPPRKRDAAARLSEVVSRRVHKRAACTGTVRSLQPG